MKLGYRGVFGFLREYITNVKCSVKGYVHVREIWKKCDVMDS